MSNIHVMQAAMTGSPGAVPEGRPMTSVGIVTGAARVWERRARRGAREGRPEEVAAAVALLLSDERAS
jgi:NAD(P)-dependent dehydrogenase (short-subunit alcohol dehydrogenase family)